MIADGLSPNRHRASASTSRNYIKYTCQNSAGVNNPSFHQIRTFYITENTILIVNKARFISIKYKHAKCQIARLLCKTVASILAFTTGVNYVSNANTHKRDIPWFRYNTLWNRHQTIKPQKLTTLCVNPGVPAFGVVWCLISMSFHVNGWLKQYLSH